MRELLRPAVLLGPPGAGKSAAGALAARRAGLPFVDLDERCDVESLLADGEAAFRARELAALASALDEGAALIAAGAGIVTTPEARALLAKQARCLLLDVTEGAALTRLDGKARPLLGDGDAAARGRRYRALEEARRAHRTALCSKAIDTTGASLDDVAARLGAALAEPERPIVAAGLPEAVSFSFAGVVSDGRCVVVDEGAAAPFVAATLTLPGGEQHKTPAAAAALAERLVEAGLTRDGTLVAVGGGAHLDLCGFVAATLHRGVRWIAVPTTLLAMTDAALGGKTAVNLPSGKNLLGAFHPPARVVVDMRFLQTLPARQRRAAGFEMLKHSLLAHDAPLDGSAAGADAAIARVAQGGASDDETLACIARSLTIKHAVVERDPEERHLRRALNLGHTFGHALEHEARGALLHGEAVGYGLRFAIELSVMEGALVRGVADRMHARVDEIGLTPAPPVDEDRLLARMIVDKKGRRDGLRFLVLDEPGAPAVLAGVRTTSVRECLRRALRRS